MPSVFFSLFGGVNPTPPPPGAVSVPLCAGGSLILPKASQVWGTALLAVSPVGEALFTTPGTHVFVVPEGVFSLCIVAIGAGGGGQSSLSSSAGWLPGGGGGGGGLGWRNEIPVTPGQVLMITVGQGGLGGAAGGRNSGQAGGDTYVTGLDYELRAYGGKGAGGATGTGDGGGYCGADGGGVGGKGQPAINPAGGSSTKGGGGAAGYTGSGGLGGAPTGDTLNGASYATNGTGGGGGGGDGFRGNGTFQRGAGGGGGTGLYGQGANGARGWSDGAHPGFGVPAPIAGQAGSSGQTPALLLPNAAKTAASGGPGGLYGGGGAGGHDGPAGNGANGAVRILWGPGRSFPSSAA